MPQLPKTIHYSTFLDKIERQRGPARQVVTKGGRLWGYAQRNPSDMERGRAYQYIYSAAERLVKAVPGLAATHRFVHNDANIWNICSRTEDSFPDAYLCPAEDDGQPLSWEKIAVSGVYASEDTEGFAVMVCTLPYART